MYSWGDGRNGSLGQEAKSEGGAIMEATPCPHFKDKKIKSVASNIFHTLILLDDGVLYSCGSNDYGQLGHEEKTVIIPAHVDILERSVVSKVDCGTKHSVAITSEGILYSWGDNSEGQLGLKSLQPKRQPSLLSLPTVRPVVQVTCGGHHTLALTQDGRVYSWGRNTSGQLGHSKGQSRVILPTPIKHLESVPVVSLVAGGDHSVALTVSGTVFVWGNNKCGQLGLGHVTDRSDPTLNDYMCTHPVTHVACGDDHTVFQLKGGTIYTTGSNQYGQLGRGELGTSYPRPDVIMELTDTVVQQVVCGRHHTVILAKYTGEVIAFGQSEMGQLGSGVPPWSCPKRHNKSPSNPDSSYVVVKRLFAGGDRTFATIILPDEEDNEDIPVDCGTLDVYGNKEGGPCYLSCDMIKQMLDVSLFTNNYTGTLNTLQMFFSSPSCVNGSFLIKTSSNRYSEIDYTGLVSIFKLMRERLYHYQIDAVIAKAFSHGLLASLPDPHPCDESLRIFLVILSYPLVCEYPGCLSIIVTFVKVFLYISDEAKDTIANWLFSDNHHEVLLSWIEIFRAPIGRIVASGKDKIEHGQYTRTRDNANLIHLTDDQTWALQEGIKVLRWLYEGNRKRKEPVPYQKFYISEVTECCDLGEDYHSYRTNRVDRVLFMRYSFVLNAAGKSELIQTEGKWRMMEAIAKAHHRNILNMFSYEGIRDFSPTAFILQVRRTNLLQDTISAFLSHTAQDLLKPLRVQFEGEEGIDDGGVQKEFFMLLIREVLNPDFGMFYEEEESKLIWFREQLDPIDHLEKQYYQMIGLICSLAIYNGVIVDLPFPVVLYKKLLNMHSGPKAIPPNLDDLHHLKPSVGKHLKELLNCDSSQFNEQYGDLHFELTRGIYGSVVTVPLIPNGSSISVTVNNRQEYVDHYVKYELVSCIAEQYEAFAQGFTRVCNIKSDVFENLHPEELLSLVTGSSVFDIKECKSHTSYLNKYHKDHSVINCFWSVVCDFSLEAKKKLLVFWTGTNRVPVAGVKSLKLIIQYMDGGPHCQKLPVAHTCSNILDLPPYSTHELMKEKILQAIYFTEGFGII